MQNYKNFFNNLILKQINLMLIISLDIFIRLLIVLLFWIIENNNKLKCINKYKY